MNKILSIIIPYYNAKEYTDELLSLLDKQIDTEEIEVLLIDDGSKEEYTANYNWLKIIRQDNGGASAARNTGLDNAIGEYISFIDSDDLISDNYREPKSSHLSVNFNGLIIRVDETIAIKFDIEEDLNEVIDNG